MIDHSKRLLIKEILMIKFSIKVTPIRNHYKVDTMASIRYTIISFSRRCKHFGLCTKLMEQTHTNNNTPLSPCICDCSLPNNLKSSKTKTCAFLHNNYCQFRSNL